ncbi:MAG: selenite/tellurite reduction operon porin ExtI [Burkholderiales bacterium]
MNARPGTSASALSRPARRLAAATALALVAGAAAPALAGPTITFGEEGYLTLSYAFQLWTRAQSYTSPTDNGSMYDTYFRRNRLLFAGQANDLVGFYVQIEAGNDDKLGNSDKEIYYRDAYATVDFRDDLRLIAGRFKNTFSRENLEACLEPLSVDRGEILPYTPFGNQGGTRDTGVALWGNVADGKFQYRLMLADGRQGDEIPKKSPRVTGRVHVALLDPEADYGYKATYLGTRKVFTVGAAFDYQADVAYGNFPERTDLKDYRAFTADAFFEYPTRSGTYTLSGAYFDYDTGNAINASPDPRLPVTSQLKGFYVKGAYLFPNKFLYGRLQPYFRFEKLDFDQPGGAFDQRWSGAGVNYYLNGQNLRLSLEYANVKFDTQHPTNASLQDYDHTTLALQFIF